MVMKNGDKKSADRADAPRLTSTYHQYLITSNHHCFVSYSVRNVSKSPN